MIFFRLLAVEKYSGRRGKQNSDTPFFLSLSGCEDDKEREREYRNYRREMQA